VTVLQTVAAREAPSLKQLEVNGTSLAYVEQGTGTPVVFVHGSGADLRTWGNQMAPVGASYRAIAYSRRYHHPNAVPDGGPAYSAALHATDLEGFIDQLHAGPVHLVASSYGAAVALLAARDRPALVRSMVLTEPALLSLLSSSAPERAGLAGLSVARERLAAGDTDGAIASFVDTIIGPGASMLMPASTRVMIHDNLPALRREAAAPDPDPVFSCADAARVRAPVLLLTGGSSPGFFLAIARELAACLPIVEHVSVPGAAHAVHAQQPARFNELVLGFLKKH
jgi:pimeloyl-ACP methyl ester carboxylesterase